MGKNVNFVGGRGDLGERAGGVDDVVRGGGAPHTKDSRDM